MSKSPSPVPMALPALALGDAVTILANKRAGTIRGIYDYIGSERSFLVRYVNDTGTVCEDWLRRDDLATPKPAKKPAAKA